MKINLVNKTNFYKSHNLNCKPKPSFKQTLKEQDCDCFEKSPQMLETYDLTIENPIGTEIIKVTHHPLDKAIIYQKTYNYITGKTKKTPISVDVAISKDNAQTTFHFVEPKTKEEIGYVIVENTKEAAMDEKYRNVLEKIGFLKDYPEFGIVGDRVSIEYLHNNDTLNYSGIGKAADQVAVEYCQKLGIKPNIISIAALDSHAAHYKRGRRFFPTDKSSLWRKPQEFFNKFKTNDPNEIVKERIEKTHDKEYINCTDLGPLMMYMPQDVIKKYQELAEKNPILH